MLVCACVPDPPRLKDAEWPDRLTSRRVGSRLRVYKGWGCFMVDHIQCARNYRKRAAACRTIAEDILSGKFRNCYCELADHYLSLANLEEDFARREAARAWECR
jgi:hypothetical protein